MQARTEPIASECPSWAQVRKGVGGRTPAIDRRTWSGRKGCGVAVYILHSLYLSAPLLLSLFFLLPSILLAQPIDPLSIAAELASDTPTVFQQGLSHVRQLISERSESPGMLRDKWLPILMDGGHYAEVDELALQAILANAAETAVTDALQRYRVQALLKQGKATAALANARSLFNVAPMATTDKALILVAECLAAARPDQLQIALRFHDEQIVGAGARLRDNQDPPTTMHMPVSAIMLEIQIDPKPYEAAIAHLDPARYLIHTSELRDYRSCGNLLLLAGRAREALLNFEKLRDLAEDDQIRLAANDGIARSMKAQDGTIGRANAWIVEQRAQYGHGGK